MKANANRLRAALVRAKKDGHELEHDPPLHMFAAGGTFWYPRAVVTVAM